MKTTPTINKQKLAEFKSKLSGFVLSGDWQELVPETEAMLQEIADSLTSEDAEAALSEIDHDLVYKTGEFTFSFETSHQGPGDDSPYTITLKMGSPKKPFEITVLSHV